MASKWQQWMPLKIDAFRASPAVQAMHPAARAGYIYLLLSAWQTDDCTVSADPLDLAETSGLGDELWALYGARIIRKFDEVEGGKLRNAVLFMEWQEAREIFEKNHLTPEELHEKRSNAGRKGNEVRWPTRENAERGKVLRSERLANARKIATHTQQQWEALVVFCEGMCVRCGSDARLVKDHIIPIYQGGSDGIDNLQPLCAECNSSKGRENKDFRLANWKDCLANASQMPSNASPTVTVTGTETVTSTQEQVQKPSRAKAARATKTALADERHTAFKGAIKTYWDTKNPGVEMPWGPMEGKQLGMWLREAPHISLDQFTGFLRARFKSDVNHGERPSQWIKWVTSYGNGPIDRYNKPIQENGNGTNKPSVTHQRVAANDDALGAALTRRGINPACLTGQANAPALPEPRPDGQPGGVLVGFRTTGPEVLPPEGHSGPGGTQAQTGAELLSAAG